ncbi:MAG: NFACT family protein [Ruthenibacterium lactatiformans]
MALDAAALALCAKELSAALADARIDKIFEPTRDEVVLNLRTRTDNPRLFLSARSGSARACLTKETFENPQTPPSFCMQLRKHFTGGRLLEVRTLPDERILFFDFQCTNEMGDTVVNTMARADGPVFQPGAGARRKPGKPGGGGRSSMRSNAWTLRTARFGSFCRARLHAAAPAAEGVVSGRQRGGHRGGGVAERTARSGGTHQDNGRRARWFAAKPRVPRFRRADVTASRMTEQEKAALLRR